MRRRLLIALIVPLAGLAACSRAAPGTPPPDALASVVETRTLTFDQKNEREDVFEEDILLPPGAQDCRLFVTCAACKDPVWVRFELTFAGASPPSVRLSLRKAHEPVRPSQPEPSCFEAMFQQAPIRPRCTIYAQSGWETDALARRFGNPNPDEGDDARRRPFIARIENRGAPIQAHVTLSMHSAPPL